MIFPTVDETIPQALSILSLTMSTLLAYLVD
jgi:hypothetical protein